MKREYFAVIVLVFGLILVNVPSMEGKNGVKDTPAAAANRIQPSDIQYLGAFRLPDGDNGAGVKNWMWAGEGLTYYPGGDPSGPSDGYPGSLYGTGHNWSHEISEINIPVPVVSASKNLNQLNTASTLQNFYDILNVSSFELPRSDMQYLAAQGSQSNGKIYYCIGAHYQETGDLTHGWFELNLASPQTAGNWVLSGTRSYSANDYMMDIPASWAASHTPGLLLASGRFRDGGWSGQGPSLFAFGPWNHGNPPASGTQLNTTTLLLYTSSEDFGSTQYTMTNYHHSDEWSGGAWLSAGSKSAVVFVGTKGTGNCWYGFANGVVWPDEPPYPPIPDPPYDDRGWWSTGFEGQVIFYDTDDLAAVAAGSMNPWEPQPYASLDIDSHLFSVASSQDKYHLGACSFDRQNGFLYVIEPLADGDKSLIHVWKVNGGGVTPEPEGELSLSRSKMIFGCASSYTDTQTQTFRIINQSEDDISWTVTDDSGWISVSPDSGSGDGLVTVTINPKGLTVGRYSGFISVSSSGISNSPLTLPVTLNYYSDAGSTGPFGSFELPTGEESLRGSVAVTGWVLDDTAVYAVKIYLLDNGSRTWIGDALLVEGARADVEAAFPDYPHNDKAGWGYMMLTNYLPNGGNGTYTLYVEAVDYEGNRTELGTRVITCDNANAVKPFGAIDTPAQGGKASGSQFVNFGWVLTPPPNTIPIDGSTIHVYIDGVRVGSPVYNQPRGDIAALFPTYNNSSAAAGYFLIDTTAYDDGVHSIQWTAADDAGNTDGIGSRYFTIRNSGSRLSAPTNRRRGAPGISPAARSLSKHRPLAFKTGYNEAKPFQTLKPGPKGDCLIKIPVLERVVLRLSPGCKGYLEAGGRLKPLPAGSYLDTTSGMFYWQPGPGCRGMFHLMFKIRNQYKNVYINVGGK